MRKIVIAAFAAASLVPVTAASAGTWSDLGVENAVLDASNTCALTSKQLSMGFACYVATTTTVVHREIAVKGNIKCQEGTATSTTYYAVNKADNIMDSRTAAINAEFAEEGDVEWSGPPVNGACPA